MTSHLREVGLGPGGAVGPDGVNVLRRLGAPAHGSVDAALRLAVELSDTAPLPGTGNTRGLWELLATLAAHDLTTARAVEPHLDALAILAQAPEQVDLAAVGADRSSSWGVYAAESPGMRLEARPAGSGWRVDGTKPWCSLAGSLSHAIVTAHSSDATRRAFAVSLGSPGVTREPGRWVARGLVDIPSRALSFHEVPAVPVGADGWYLERPGFAWGGMGVAACWYGGVVGLARTLAGSARRRTPDQIALMHLGTVDATLHGARSVLLEGASLVDAGEAGAGAGTLLAQRVRHVVFSAAELVLRRLDHALGPGPLVSDAAHAARAVDLHLYLRQHHAERDEAALGAAVLSEDGSGW